MFKKLYFWILLGALCTNSMWQVMAQSSFTKPANTDTRSSMGTFTIHVLPKFQPIFTNIFGGTNANWDGQYLKSPVFLDQSTKIAHSTLFTEGDATDQDNTVGVAVGNPPFFVKKNQIPLYPLGWPLAAGRNKVRTELRAMNLAPSGGECDSGCMPNPIFSGSFVRAGAELGISPRSVGEVEANAAGGPPDFPATSFFDVFVQIHLGALPSDLHNNMPLLVANGAIKDLPPTVVYIHENSTGVAVYWNIPGSWPPTAPATDWIANEQMGYLSLAGHGVGYTPCDPILNCTKLAQQVDSVRTVRGYMPDPPSNPSITEWGMIVLGVLLAASAAWIFLRKRRSATAI